MVRRPQGWKRDRARWIEIGWKSALSYSVGGIDSSYMSGLRSAAGMVGEWRGREAASETASPMSMSCCGHESQSEMLVQRGKKPYYFFTLAREGKARQGSRPGQGCMQNFQGFSLVGNSLWSRRVGLVKKPECRPESRPIGHVNVEGIRQTREGMTKKSRPNQTRLESEAGFNFGRRRCWEIRVVGQLGNDVVRYNPDSRMLTPVELDYMFLVVVFFFVLIPYLSSSLSYFSCVISTTPATTQTSLGRSTRTEHDRRKPPGNASAAGASSRWNGALGQSWKPSQIVNPCRPAISGVSHSPRDTHSMSLAGPRQKYPRAREASNLLYIVGR